MSFGQAMKLEQIINVTQVLLLLLLLLGAGSNAAWQHRRNDARDEPTSGGCGICKSTYQPRQSTEKKSLAWYAAVTNPLQVYGV